MDPLASAVVALFTGILGTEAIKRILTASQDRESSAQSAIIDLAREAINGWREESKAVVRITDVLQTHDQSNSYYYKDLRDRSAEQSERLDMMDDQIRSLVTILGGAE